MLTLKLNPFFDGVAIDHRNKIYVSKVDLTTPDELNYPTTVLSGDNNTLPGFVNLLEITSDDPDELNACERRTFSLTLNGLQILPIGPSLQRSPNDSLYVWFLARRKFSIAPAAAAAANLVITISTEDEDPIMATLPMVPVVGTAP